MVQFIIRTTTALGIAFSLVACGGGGGGSAPVPITFTSSQVVAEANSASVSNTYLGTGTGIWRYTNDANVVATGDINIQGLTAGKSVTLVFANTSVSDDAPSLPSSGALASPAWPVASAIQVEAHHNHEAHVHRGHHDQMLQANRLLALEMHKEKATTSLAPLAAKIDTQFLTAPRPVVAGDTRVWNENGFTKVDYTTTAQRVCAAGILGRKVVIWVQNSVFPSLVTNTQLNAYQATFCGTNNNDGAYAKISNAIGDVWGSVPSKYSATRIADTAVQKQDINIVIVNPTTNGGWGGYFYSLNNRLKSTSEAYADSNEALVFFVNAGQSQNYIQTVLIHELTHMINHYQRTILNDDIYESWLEETTAMMTQDIFDPGLLTGSCLPIVCDLRAYARSGAGVSYFNWPESISRNHYDMGASFGAFINRRYGPKIYLQLTTECYTAPANTAGVTCLDMLIKNNGGVGLADEFTRFGASVFGRMGGTGEPSGFGFPASSGSVVLKTTNGAGRVNANFSYNIPAINNWWTSIFIPTTTPLTTFTYSTHTYQIDTVAAGKASYVRTGVSVPAKTTLSVIVK